MNKFAVRRHVLCDELSQGIIVLVAHTAMQSTADTSFPFQQEANFLYLTGINFPGWWLIVADGVSRLVSPDVDDAHQVFDGSLSSSEAQKISGVDIVITRQQGEALLTELAQRHETVATLGDEPHAGHYDFVLNPAPIEMRQQLEVTFANVKDCRAILATQRAIKQPEELASMQQAIDLTIDAFEVVRQKLPDLKYEYEVEAEFTYHFRRYGARSHAYEPIVASGHNACTLHYVANSALLRQGELLVLDIGARIDGYAADITRTYAIGQPTDRQRAVHGAVQQAQRAIIELLGPGVSVRDYHDQVDVIMKLALMTLGLMSSIDDEHSYRMYFPHSISHGLGIDVHDSLGAPDVFTPGMVLTVEPGIYIPEESIGVRIEDDILITEDGYQNLSGRLSTDL